MPSSSDSGSDTSSTASLPPNSLAGLSLSIFADLLSNLTHDIALQTHHTEKLLRARQQALHPPADGSPSPTATANPLTVVPSEILCPRCHLPQHTASTLDAPSGGGGGMKKKFCQRLPWQNVPLHDIYGNPFPTIKDKNTKNGNGADKNNNNSFAATDSPAEDAPGTVVLGKKGATTGLIYFKCATCENEKVLSSRYAVHLEKCLGLGRKSSRAAMAKMNSNSGSGSPMLSAVDAGPKTGSRKPSPEKKSRSPVPALNGTTDEPAAPAVVAALPKSSFHTSSAAAAATTTTGTPKKKKKKAAAVAAAAAAAALATASAAAASLPPPLPPPPSTPSKNDVPSLPLPPPATALVSAPTQKKRKRKAEAAAIAAAAAAAATAAADRQGSVVDDKDVITLSVKPPPKKQKLSAERAEKAEKGEKMEKEKSMLGEGLLPVKKSQVNKFKNGRGNSPSPGVGRKDRRTSSPNPLASPPITHKPLPPKPPIPLAGNPLGPAGSPPPVGTPKSRKPKPGPLGSGASSARKSGEASVKKSAKPKLKKGMNAASASGSGGVGAGGAGAGKTVPRIAGKNVPGVARKGVKE